MSDKLSEKLILILDSFLSVSNDTNSRVTTFPFW